jgi:hypothetical protein
MFHGGYAPEIVMLMAGQEESTFPLLNLVKSNISDIHDFSYAGHIDYNFDYYGPVYRTAAEQPEQFCGLPSLETGYSRLQRIGTLLGMAAFTVCRAFIHLDVTVLTNLPVR